MPLKRAVLALAAFGLIGAVQMPGATADCEVESDGLDTTYIDPVTRWGPFRGSALGQVFLARDLTIIGLTVWRPPNSVSLIGASLFITEVDTVVNYSGTGKTYQVPNTRKIVRSGPTVHVYDSDPPGRLIPMHFDITPPLALPHPGQYAFFIQPEACWPGEAWVVVGDTHNHYPHGIFWITGDTFGECYLRQVAGGADSSDMIFQIDYCKDATTRTRHMNWGRLKQRYRSQ